MGVVLQFAGLAVVLVIGAVLVYAIFEMREIYAEQQDRFARAATAIEEFQRIQNELLSVIQKVQTSSVGLHDAAQQIQKAIVDLRFGIDAAVTQSTERRSAAIEDLRNHLDEQENRLRETLTQTLEQTSGGARAALLTSAERYGEALDDLRNHIDSKETQLASAVEALEKIADSVRALETASAPKVLPRPDSAFMRRDVLAGNPQLRFDLLREWFSANTLAVSRRASSPWKSPRELISAVPEALQAEAEILDDAVLLVGTQGRPERLALPLKHLDTSSRFAEWFEFSSNGSSNRTESPAVLVRSEQGFESVEKGMAHAKSV